MATLARCARLDSDLALGRRTLMVASPQIVSPVSIGAAGSKHAIHVSKETIAPE